MVLVGWIVVQCPIPLGSCRARFLLLQGQTKLGDPLFVIHLVLPLYPHSPSSGLAVPVVKSSFPFAAAAFVSDSAFASGRVTSGPSCLPPGQPVPSSVLYPWRICRFCQLDLVESSNGGDGA